MLILYGTTLNLVEIYNVEYYDCAQDPDFIYNPALFRNSSHMNEAGARLFTEKLISLMNPVPGP